MPNARPKTTTPTAPVVLPEMIRLTTLANQLPAQRLQLLCEVAESLVAGEVANVNGAGGTDGQKPPPLTGVLTVKEILREVTSADGSEGAE